MNAIELVCLILSGASVLISIWSLFRVHLGVDTMQMLWDLQKTYADELKRVSTDVSQLKIKMMFHAEFLTQEPRRLYSQNRLSGDAEQYLTEPDPRPPILDYGSKGPP